MSFVKGVLEFAMPLKLKIPIIEPYYEKTDLTKHVETYIMVI